MIDSHNPVSYRPNPDAKKEVYCTLKKKRALMRDIVKKVAPRLQEEDDSQGSQSIETPQNTSPQGLGSCIGCQGVDRHNGTIFPQPQETYIDEHKI